MKINDWANAPSITLETLKEMEDWDAEEELYGMDAGDEGVSYATLIWDGSEWELDEAGEDLSFVQSLSLYDLGIIHINDMNPINRAKFLMYRYRAVAID
jgi:hypothetical protein